MEGEYFTKADWILFRKMVPKWQEAYMERLLGEYQTLISSDDDPSVRFWALNKRLQEDSRRKGVQLDMRRSMLIWNLCALIGEGAITFDDLDGFSEGLSERVREICIHFNTLE